MNIDEMTYGELKKIAAIFNQTNSAPEDHGLCLVVADRGHVWVGDVTTGENFAIVQNARIVRRWGTENGINELANNGPAESTRLDAEADVVKVAMKAIIALIPCREESWKK